MSLKERITEDMKAAMRAAEKERLGSIRMLQAAIKQREVDERITLDDSQVLSVIEDGDGGFVAGGFESEDAHGEGSGFAFWLRGH